MKSRTKVKAVVSVVKKVTKGDVVRARKDELKATKPLQNKQLLSADCHSAQANTAAPPNQPQGKRPKVARIDKSLDVCLRELNRVYKQMRRGQIKPEFGVKLVKTIQVAADILAKKEGDPAIMEALAKMEAIRQEQGLPPLQLPAYAATRGRRH